MSEEEGTVVNKAWISLWGAVTAILCISVARAEPAMADIAVHNKQQILYWLEKRGELAPDASESDKQQALTDYLAGKGQNRDMLQLKLQEKALRSKAFAARLKREHSLGNIQSVSVKQQVDSDVTKTVHVLAILIDFPDLPHDNNRLTPADTSMYYDDYTIEHYQGLLFSQFGYPGPHGQNLRSVYRYYQTASGESFYFTGDVKGWFTADHTANYYGKNDTDSNNDIRAAELVEEAITKAVSTMSADELAQYDQEDPYDLDGDGNLDEPDGIIDHVMVFHSSVGEEAGGGVLADNAIWSHRSFVQDSSNTSYGKVIPGTTMRIFGYTIQPVDAAVGVCVHEFGHDLGLPDEYDSANSNEGSPVGEWSVMASGNWTGDADLQGTRPSGFSAYARSYLQEHYKGRWVNEQVIDYEQLTTDGRDYQLVSTANVDSVNQIAINLPTDSVPFDPPYQGSFQYYSGQGNQLSTAMSFDIALPQDGDLTLQMRAKWDTELDYDYAQVLVDGVALAGNHTKASNSQNGALNIITGQSSDLADADENGWVLLSFDLSAYAGQNRQFSIIYRTDPAVGGTGLQIDNLQITTSTGMAFEDNAEVVNTDVELNGFERITDQIAGKPQRYVLQLRNYSGNDDGLRYSDYEPGVLVWYENHNIADNEVQEHPGYNLIGVVDNDQNPIGFMPTDVQLRDAALSMYDQSFYTGDLNLEFIDTFSDLNDYTSPFRPSAGLVLPALGVIVQVVTQETDSSAATINIRRIEPSASDISAKIEITAPPTSNDLSFSAEISGGTAPYTYLWDFGDGATSTEVAPSHLFSTAGLHPVKLTIVDASGMQVTIAAVAYVAPIVQVSVDTDINGLTVSFRATVETNLQSFSYYWRFGDGATSSLASPTHTYAEAGTYPIHVTISNESIGGRTVEPTTVTVVGEPEKPVGSGSSGGGSLSAWWLMLLAGLAFARRSRQVKAAKFA